MDSLTQSLELQVDITANLYSVLNDMAEGIRGFNASMSKKVDATTQLANSLKQLKINFDSNSSIIKSSAIAGRDQSNALIEAGKSIIKQNQQNAETISSSIDSISVKTNIQDIRQISSNLNIAASNIDFSQIDSSAVLEVISGIDQNSLRAAAEELTGIDLLNPDFDVSTLTNSNQVASLNTASQNIANDADALNDSGKDLNLLLNDTEDNVASLSEASDDLLLIAEESEKTTLITRALTKAVDLLTGITDAIMTGGLSLLKSLPSLAWSILKYLASATLSMTTIMAKAVAFTMTLPFTVAQVAAKWGNKIRSDLAAIREGGEEAKESFDLSSRIGQGAAILTQKAQGMIKLFQNPESKMVKLFGMGTAGINAFQKEIFTATDAMGHYAEYFGRPLMENVKLGTSFIQVQRALGLSTKDLGYYAMQAYLSGKDPTTNLLEVKDAIKKAAARSGFDFKALSLEFHKLRTNIVEFGHLTNYEIANLTAKIRGMKVKTEDAVNVFKKFSTFEEAAKASAQLYQSFQMNIDALDLLSAKDPGEMLTQFRDAMFETGKSFKDLNRHEKALMSSITGISAESLKTLMNYMDLGYTQDEARKKMEEEDPAKEQLKLIKGLTSAVKQYQKILQFDSPFQAFYEGLINNAMGHKELDQTLIDFSKVYQSLWKLGYSLDFEVISGLLGPVNSILTRIRDLITSKKFFSLLKSGLSAVSDFMRGVSYDLKEEGLNKDLSSFEEMIKGFDYTVKKRTDANMQLTGMSTNLITSFKTSIGNINSLDANIQKLLVDAKIIYKDKKTKLYSYTKNFTLKSVIDALTLGADVFKDDPKLTLRLQAVFDKIAAAYNKKIIDGQLNADEIKEAKLKGTKFTTSEGRIENLYIHLENLFVKGSPHFNATLDVGRDLMHAIVRSMFQGATIFLKLANGQITDTVQSLGLEITDQMKATAAKKGIPVKQLSILDVIGLDKKELSSVTNNLSKEVIDFTAQLPSLATMVGGLLADMMGVFGTIAGGIADGVAEYFMDYYENIDNNPKLDLVDKFMLKRVLGSLLNDNFVYQVKMRKAEKIEGSTLQQTEKNAQAGMFNQFGNISFNDPEEHSNAFKIYAENNALGLIHYFKNLMKNEISSAEDFNKDFAIYLSKQFNNMGIDSYKIANSKTDQMMRISESILFFVDAYNSHKSKYPTKKDFKQYQSNPNFNNFYQQYVNYIKHQTKKMIKKFEPNINNKMSELNKKYPEGLGESIFDPSNPDYDSNVQKAIQSLQDGAKSADSYFSNFSRNPSQYIQIYNKNNPTQNIVPTKDFELLNGKDTYVVVGNKKVYKLHPDDSLFATKEKGYWNKMLIKFANVYEDVIEKISFKSNKVFESLRFKISTFKKDINYLSSSIEKYSKKILTTSSDRISQISNSFNMTLEKALSSYSQINNLIEIQNKEIAVANSQFEKVNIVKSNIENILKQATNNLSLDENASEDDINELYDLCKDIIMIAVNKQTVVNTQVVI